MLLAVVTALVDGSISCTKGVLCSEVIIFHLDWWQHVVKRKTNPFFWDELSN
jgi:hypothetical protein